MSIYFKCTRDEHTSYCDYSICIGHACQFFTADDYCKRLSDAAGKRADTCETILTNAINIYPKIEQWSMYEDWLKACDDYDSIIKERVK
jgi:hypothetical protein